MSSLGCVANECINRGPNEKMSLEFLKGNDNMSFPLEKYTYVYVDNKVIAMSTYAGRIVKGVAKCNPNDEYDVQKGRELAAARCNAKIARKRMLRAEAKYEEAHSALEKAEKNFVNMNDYYYNARKAYNLAAADLEELEEQL